MGTPKDIKATGSRPPEPGRPQGTGSGSSRDPAPAAAPATGRVVHDDRGNAVWDWVKETSRIAIESTSRLLKKLEVPELKMEDESDNELRIEPDRDAGGGYDPYNQVTKPRGKR
jgi:hypothetical protein